MAVLSEIEFYDRLAESFDVMTDWPARLAYEMPFLEATLKRLNAQAVLDCACGTGWHAIELVQRGYQVKAGDASNAMVARARENAARQKVDVPFAVARFVDLRQTFTERFDAVLCLGNSFPHVLTDDLARRSLQGMRACLRPGGALVLHNLNYDKRWRDKPRWFPVNSGKVEGRETLVWRFADYGSKSITFNTALFTRSQDAQWSVTVQSTEQRPYQSSELTALLAGAGFDEVALFGNLKGDAYEAFDSGDLVIVATARAEP